MKPLVRFWKKLAQASAVRRLVRFYNLNQDQLKRDYFLLASTSGLPRGLAWTSCEWQPELVVLQSRADGTQILLVAILLGFEAIPGGGMEDVEAVSSIRQASAVFQWDGKLLRPTGRTLFNMPPVVAARHLESDYAVVFQISP